jgi:hypothetical protein
VPSAWRALIIHQHLPASTTKTMGRRRRRHLFVLADARRQSTKPPPSWLARPRRRPLRHSSREATAGVRGVSSRASQDKVMSQLDKDYHRLVVARVRERAGKILRSVRLNMSTVRHHLSCIAQKGPLGAFSALKSS